MKIELDSMQGGLRVSNTPNCRILRHIYGWRYDITRCLLRIYAFKTKTIVIASHLIGGVNWDSYLISKVVRDFGLNINNLTWIAHLGLFSDCMFSEEEFFETIIDWEKEWIFSPKECNLIEQKDISLDDVEKLIECRLEPVERWLGLDPIIQNKRREKYQEQTQNLLELFLQNNLAFLSEHSLIKEQLSQALIGALFFYPERKKNSRENCVKFLRHEDLERSENKCELYALSYMSQYLPNQEIVICVCTEESYYYCTVLAKRVFLMFV